MIQRISVISAAPVSILTLEHPYERVITRTVFGLLCILACAYLYFVTFSVMHVVAHKEALVQSAHLTDSISQLERRYFDLSRSVTRDEGARLGLSDITPSYVYATGNTAVNVTSPHTNTVQGSRAF